eukprot:TRINITY_DN9718_c0_g1_i2.p1 TRINITY_DN9718_c0_g1~~TRINITY_DN9718_c0_g1_i2.p1  ORF type:complete len:532 (-),score=69.29 TRINITY_DN9718_c0_g1_i2:26-1432(-)
MAPTPCATGVTGLGCRLELVLCSGLLRQKDLDTDLQPTSGRGRHSVEDQQSEPGNKLLGTVIFVATALGLVGALVFCCNFSKRHGPSDSYLEAKGSPRNQMATSEVKEILVEEGDVPTVSYGQAPEDLYSGFTWLCTASDEDSRKSRREVAAITENAIENRSYTTSTIVPLQFVEDMLSGTRIISPTVGDWSGEPHSFPCLGGTQVRVVNGSLLDVAKQQVDAGCCVAVVNPASGYDIGGGFTSGGRHALEESMCVQSTLYGSLKRSAALAGKARTSAPLSARRPSWFSPFSRPPRATPRTPRATPRTPRNFPQPHIPEDGAILSPSVEVFRANSETGYTFLQSPWVLPAVISVAMPNNNDQVAESPMDAQRDPELYEAQLMARWRAAVAAAAHFTEADTLVVPDAGCGAFKNPPEKVGAALGKVLRKEFPSRFDQVLLVCGASSYAGTLFAESVQENFFQSQIVEQH